MKKRLPRLPDDLLPKLHVPIRRLTAADRPALLDHYLGLSLAERTAQFGHPLSDEKLAGFTRRLDFEADGHFAALGAASVFIGVAHCLVFDGQGVVSVQVAQGYRRRGVGTALGAQLTYFGRTRALSWLRAYFSKGDPIAASLARACGMVLNFGIDRFYAEYRLLPGPALAARAPRAVPNAQLQSPDVRNPESAEAPAPA